MSSPIRTESTVPSPTQSSPWVAELREALHEVIIGQESLLHGLLIGLLTGGHVLLEGVPGLAKSLAVSSLAGAVRGSFSRLQFTPDLLPSDLVGTEIYNVKEGSFSIRKGPLFANFVLADEVNRAPAKVQSALLESMQEHQVSIGGETFALPHPFLVLATQNPLEHEGTYPLPEAQLDRFALKLHIDYPDRQEEFQVLERMACSDPPQEVRKVVELETILEARKQVDAVRVDQRLKEYIVALVVATRDPRRAGLEELATRIHIGASPRASIWLTMASRAHAFLEGRDYATPGDIKRVALEVMRHRVIPTYEADAEGLTPDMLVTRVLETVPVP